MDEKFLGFERRKMGYSSFYGAKRIGGEKEFRRCLRRSPDFPYLRLPTYVLLTLPTYLPT